MAIPIADKQKVFNGGFISCCQAGRIIGDSVHFSTEEQRAAVYYYKIREPEEEQMQEEELKSI